METELIPINENLALPAAELQFRFSTGGGPGGQHVNKTATRVTLLFDVANSPSLDEDTRARLLDRLASRLDRRGLLHIDVHESRSQWQNRATAVARLQGLLADAPRLVFGQSGPGGWLVVADLPPDMLGGYAEPLAGDEGRLLANMLRALRLDAGEEPVHVMRVHRGSGNALTGDDMPRPLDEVLGPQCAPLAPRVVQLAAKFWF